MNNKTTLSNTSTSENKKWYVEIHDSGLTAQKLEFFNKNGWTSFFADASDEKRSDGMTPIWMVFQKRLSKKRLLERAFLCGLEEVQ
jgi:hypothetical protein